MDRVFNQSEECEVRRAHQMSHPLHWYMNNGYYYTPLNMNSDITNQTPTNSGRPPRKITPSYLKKTIYDKYDSTD
ncbi:hypothetical protein A3Q56_08159 [Intoshia linei]|uniref:Uncharacterized protein n=1 Tax=Intoshia linei TaxID=1819745 RepID=A0A177ARY0_9BILA|nr:hypothetical protein A3Q56_08159 [Intoshia linei]